MAIDVGKKRIGIAVTDPLQIIATGLPTVEAAHFWTFLADYTKQEAIDLFVVGWPVTLDNRPSDSMQYVSPFVEKLQSGYPAIPVEKMDERFTSSMAHQSMIEGGVPKKKRQDKSLADRLSAVIILQSWMEKKNVKLR